MASVMKDLRKKDADDLHEALTARRTELMELRFSHATGALENPTRMRQVKRDIARIHTVLSERVPAAGNAATVEQ